MKLKGKIMREIKFRGKRVDNGEWTYGDYIEVTQKNHNILPKVKILNVKDNDTISIKYDLERIEFKTLGQYTGLKDKNGVEIYEGDICHIKNEPPWHPIDEINEVIFKDGVFYCGYRFCSINDIQRQNGFVLQDVFDIAEVIGNIHENPKLLKGE